MTEDVPPVPDDLGARPLLEQIAYWFQRGDKLQGDERRACYETATKLRALRDARDRRNKRKAR